MRGRSRRLLPIRLDRATGLVALCLLTPTIGCRSEPAPARTAPTAQPASGRPIVLIGLDGLEWNVVLPLIREGRMPNLEALMARGVFGTLTTYPPAFSPVIWTSVATGKRPEKHGINGFVRLDAERNQIPLTSADRRTMAIWNILSDFERSAVIIGWWNTFPVEEIRGIMVAQTNTADAFHQQRQRKGTLVRGAAGQVHPPQRQSEFMSIVDDVDGELNDVLEMAFGDVGNVRSPVNRANWQSCRWSFRADEAYRRIALKLARETPAPDLFAVYFGSTDVVGHRFWRFHEPQAFRYPPGGEGLEKFGNVVRDCYAHADRVVGEIVACFPPDATLFVLSDHGMYAANRAHTFDGVHVPFSGEHTEGPPGVFVAAGPAIRRAQPPRPIRELTKEDLPLIGDVVDIAPTLLALLGLPVGRDMDGKVLAAILNPEFEESFDVAFVASHDSPEWLAARRTDIVETPGTAERIEQLRALGYLGGDDPAPAATMPAAPAPQDDAP